MSAPQRQPKLSRDANALVMDMACLIQPTIHQLIGRVTRQVLIHHCTDKVMAFAFMRMADEIGLTEENHDGIDIVLDD